MLHVYDLGTDNVGSSLLQKVNGHKLVRWLRLLLPGYCCVACYSLILVMTSQMLLPDAATTGGISYGARSRLAPCRRVWVGVQLRLQ